MLVFFTSDVGLHQHLMMAWKDVGEKHQHRRESRFKQGKMPDTAVFIYLYNHTHLFRFPADVGVHHQHLMMHG